MRSRWTVASLIMVTVFGGNNLRGGAATAVAKEQPKSMEQTAMANGMKSAMMYDHRGSLMSECKRVMRAAAGLEPPAGTEQLQQLQVQAELMRKMGEIVARYADEIKEDLEKTP